MRPDVTIVSDLLEARLLAPEPHEAVRVALVIPLSGTLGMVGPAAVNCATLAVAELNAGAGILGRPVELVLVDGGRSPAEVTADVMGLVEAGAVRALVGSHASDVRIALTRALGGRLPFVYTPPYEGGEHTPGVYLSGETPERQLLPVLRWFAEVRGRRRWALVGNDYVWPRRLHGAATRYLKDCGAEVVTERHAPRGLTDPAPLLHAIAASRADAVLLTLVGADLTLFNRAFAASPLAGRVVRLCAALEENGLLGAGGDDTGELYASMGFFASMATEACLDFTDRYTGSFGTPAPILNGHAEGLYGGLRLLAALADRARSLHSAEIDVTSDGVSIMAGRGMLTVTHRHVAQSVHLARADGLSFDVLRSF
ncbi:substrate-binding domain-containing protein [Longispora urticae]